MKEINSKRLKVDTRIQNPDYWCFDYEVSKRRRGILAQLGTSKGELKRGITHPHFKTLVFYGYRKLLRGSFSECWVNAETYQKAEERRLQRQRARSSEIRNLKERLRD